MSLLSININMVVIRIPLRSSNIDFLKKNFHKFFTELVHFLNRSDGGGISSSYSKFITFDFY